MKKGTWLLLCFVVGCASSSGGRVVEESLDQTLQFRVAMAPIILGYLKPPKDKNKKGENGAKAEKKKAGKPSASRGDKKGKKSFKAKNGASPKIDPEKIEKDLVKQFRQYKIFTHISALPKGKITSTKAKPLLELGGNSLEVLNQRAKKGKDQLLMRVTIDDYRVENLGYNGWWWVSSFLWFGFFGTQWLPPNEDFQARITLTIDVFSTESEVLLYSQTFSAAVKDNLSDLNIGWWPGWANLLGVSLLWNKKYPPEFFDKIHKRFFARIQKKLHYQIIRTFIRKFAPYTKGSKFQSDLMGVGFPPNLETDLKKGKKFDTLARFEVNLADDRGIKKTTFKLFYTPSKDKKTWKVVPLRTGRSNKPGIYPKLISKKQQIKFRRYKLRVIFPNKGKYLFRINCEDEDKHNTKWEFPIEHVKIERKLYAVVIGVGKFKDPNIQTLKYPKEDALALAKLLEKRKKELHLEKVFRLTDEKATAFEIRKVLGVQLPRMCGPYDTVMIFYSGHGMAVEDPSSPDKDHLEKYFVPHDAEKAHMYSTALPMGDLQKIIGRLPSERVMIFIDSCYSGASLDSARQFGIKSMSSASADIDATFRNRFKRRGLLVMTASDTNQYSYESDKLGHGYFTYYLLEGLRGKYDPNHDGKIQVSELSRYIVQNVQKSVWAEKGKKQTPSVIDNLPVDFSIINYKK